MNNTNDVSGVMHLPYMELGGGFVLGMFLGFFFKTFNKNFQMLIKVLVMMGIILMFLDYVGMITINEPHLTDMLDKFISNLESFWIAVKQKFEHYQFEGGMSVLLGFLVGMNLVKAPAKK